MTPACWPWLSTRSVAISGDTSNGRMPGGLLPERVDDLAGSRGAEVKKHRAGRAGTRPAHKQLCRKFIMKIVPLNLADRGYRIYIENGLLTRVGSLLDPLAILIRAGGDFKPANPRFAWRGPATVVKRGGITPRDSGDSGWGALQDLVHAGIDLQKAGRPGVSTAAPP